MKYVSMYIVFRYIRVYQFVYQKLYKVFNVTNISNQFVIDDLSFINKSTVIVNVNKTIFE